MKKILLLSSLILPLFLADGCKKEKAEVHVQSVSFEPAEIELTEGDTRQLEAVVSPKNADDKTLEWSSSAPRVATVSQEGLVTALTPGETVVKAVAKDGGVSGSCAITVVEKYHPVEAIALDKTTLPLKQGTNFTFTVSFTPENATNRQVGWESADTDIAMVDSKGKVVGVAPGKVKITATSVDNPKATASCEVEVTSDAVAVTGISVAPSGITVEVGKTGQLTSTLEPANATDQKVRWTSSDENIATVGEAGLVTGVSKGTAEITVTSQDGGFQAKSSVTVINNPITALAIDGASEEPITVEYGSSRKVVVLVTPADASNQEMSWESDDYDIMQITDENGPDATLVFNYSKAGAVTLTVTSEETPSVSVSQRYYVKAVPTAISLPSSVVVDIGGTVSPSVAFAPACATETGLTWTSSNTKVATVDSEGKVTGVAQGTATLTAKSTAADGVQASCTITVLGANMVSINGAAAVSYATGALASVLSAAGTVTSLSWESGLIAGDDINAISEHRATIQSLDLSNVAFRTGDAYKNTSVESTIAEDSLPDYFCHNFSSLKTVVMPHVGTIGKSAFYQCRNLTSLTMQSEVKKVLGYAFMYCTALTTLDLSGITEINGSYAFNTSGLSGVLDLSSMESISGDSVFGYSKQITKIVFGRNLRQVSYNMFSTCEALTSIEIPEENPNFSFENGAIISKDRTKLYCTAPAMITGTYTIPSGVKEIWQHAFDGVPATAFVIHEGVEKLSGMYTFGHSSATEFTLPSTIKSLGSYVFGYSNSLKSVTVKAVTPPDCGKNIFTNCGSMNNIYVPAEAVQAYKAANGWSTYSSMIYAIE